MDFTKSAPNLHTLPVEILCYLFSFLRASSILSCTSTCRYLRKVLDDSSALQYAIELEAQKMVEVTAPDTMTSPAERLEILRNQMCSWRAFKPTIVDHFLQPGGEVSMSFGHLYTWDDHPQIAQIRMLDSGPSESQLYRRWDADSYPIPKDTPFRVHSVCMDPSQDLFAFVVLEPNHMAEISCRIYLETLSTSEPHPLAASEILTSFKPHISANCHFDQTKIKLKIWGDRIVLLNICDEYSACPARMQIWNWQEKQDFKCVYREQEPYGKMDDCCIVNQNHLIVSCRMTSRLPCKLNIFSFSDLGKPPVHVAECVLPFQPEGTFLRHSPFVTISPDIRCSMAPQDARFYPNAKNQLIALNVDGPPSLVLIIDTDKLLTACQSGIHTKGQSRVLPWKEWGPNCSRCIVDPVPNSQYVLRLEVAGDRAVHATPNDDGTSYSLRTYDFNKYRMSRAAASEDFCGCIITEPSTVKHQQLDEQIITNLPYMVVMDEERIETASDLIDVTFDDENILIIKSSEQDENEFVIDVAKPSSMAARGK